LTIVRAGLSFSNVDVKSRHCALAWQILGGVEVLIANRKKAKGLTQEKLAEYMDIEKETVSRIETGVISPTLAQLAQLAKFLDCAIGDLQVSVSAPDQALSLARRMENLSENQRIVLTELFGKIATAMEKLSPKDRKVIEKFLSDFL
jgi:transcriptional regulator with XRE-family HTH domain